MEILPLELDGKTGAESRQGGSRVAHVVGRLDEAESRVKHVWVGLDHHSLAPGAVPDHQIGKPVWSGVRLRDREELRGDWEELLADETAVILLAERGDTAVGYAATSPADEPGVAHLQLAGTRPDVRGSGVGRALAEHAPHRAHEDGYQTVLADWRSTNLLAARFWPARGFVPTHIRLRRDIQPAA